MSSSGIDSPRGGSGWFTYGRWMRGGAAAVGGQILLLYYVIGFGLSVLVAVVALLQQARIAFHVYLGWDCLFVLPWMLGALALYRCCPLVWPFAIGHGLFDVLQTLQTYGDRATSDIARAVLISAVAGAAAAAACIVAARLRANECQRRTERRPQSSATSDRPG